MFSSIPSPSLAAEKQGPGLTFSIENEKFKPRMQISSENIFVTVRPRAVSYKGGFGERTLVPVFVLGEYANVPSFWFSFRGNIRMYPRSGFRSGGTSAKTTLQKYSTIKFAISKFYCRGVSHEKQRFGRFSSLPPRPPLKNQNIFILIVVSPSLTPFWKTTLLSTPRFFVRVGNGFSCVRACKNECFRVSGPSVTVIGYANKEFKEFSGNPTWCSNFGSPLTILNYATPIGAFSCPETRAFTGFWGEISSTVSKILSDREVPFKRR